MNAFIKSLATTRAGFGLTILRVLVGITFAAHGSQKLFGWFGGYGLAGVPSGWRASAWRPAT